MFNNYNWINIMKKNIVIILGIIAVLAIGIFSFTLNEKPNSAPDEKSPAQINWMSYEEAQELNAKKKKNTKRSKQN